MDAEVFATIVQKAQEDAPQIVWDRHATEKLVALGLSWEHARIAVGEIAEHRQIADRQGYNRGFEAGVEFVQSRPQPQTTRTT